MKKQTYDEVGDIELPDDVADRVDEMTAQADREIEEARVNFRWGPKQVDVVKRAAALMGVPYQTYMKEAVFRQAIADIEAAKRALP